MKKILFLLMILSFIDCKKFGDYNGNTKLKVIAKSGLHLREKPDQKSKSILLLPMNSEVELLDNSKQMETIANQTGEWLKVKFKDKEGFAFSAFLQTIQVGKNAEDISETMEPKVDSKSFNPKDSDYSFGIGCSGLTYSEYASFIRLDKNKQAVLEDSGMGYRDDVSPSAEPSEAYCDDSSITKGEYKVKDKTVEIQFYEHTYNGNCKKHYTEKVDKKIVYEMVLCNGKEALFDKEQSHGYYISTKAN
jgi:hypothetical protein